jgi:putative CocE/NonD family hydrolase
MRFVEAGYALVYQMIRGQGRSQGTFSFSAPHEKTDGYDTVEWIAAQPWCNGKVGMDGGSYLGMTALAAAAARPPHLTCISTSVPSADFFREIPYFGGGFSRQHTLNWLNLIQIDSLAELSGGFLGVMPILAQPDWVRRVTMRPLCDAGDDLLRDDKLAHYRDCLAHPTFDDWWREKTLGPDDYRAMDLPVLVISGNFDLGIGAMTAWHGIVAHAADRADQQLLIGPWDHGQVYNGAGTVYGPFELGDAAPGDPNLLRFAFFDRHLKGQGHGPDVGGKAKIFITGRNDYRSFDVWPPREVRTTELFLASFGRANTYRGDGELLAAPRANAPSDTMRADPALPFVPAMTSALNLQLDLREQVRHAETLVYATTPLEAPLTIFGEPVVTLHVQADTKDADIGVYLCEMRANGSVAQLARHLLRLRYREGFDREVLLMPGEPVEARIKLTFVAHEVAPGAQLALLVTPDMFPWVDPNPNTGEPIATALESRIANVTVLHDAANPSRVTLPVLP